MDIGANRAVSSLVYSSAMTRSDWSPEQAWELGQLDAPRRAASVGDAVRTRLRSLFDGGFTLEVTEGGVGVSLGRLAVLTAFCESDPMNEDSVTNWVAERKGPDGFASRDFLVVDKAMTGRVALEQLELAIDLLREAGDELESPDIPMGWVAR
jgi:hypothetical protein